MVVREMTLDCFEQLLIGATSELRPALAVDDPSLPFIDRGHIACSLRSSSSRFYRQGCLQGDLDPRAETMLIPRWRYVSVTFPRSEGSEGSSDGSVRTRD